MGSSQTVEKMWAVDSTDLPGGEGSSSQQQSNLDLCSGGIGLIEIESSLPSQQQTSSEEKFNIGIVLSIHSREKHDVNVTLTHLGEKSNETSHHIVTRSKSKAPSTKKGDTTSFTNGKKGLSKELNASSSGNSQFKPVYARATLDVVARMLHCNEEMLDFTTHALNAIMVDDPRTGRKARFKLPFEKLTIVKTSQWKKTHDDVQTEMDSCFKIERTGQYVIMEVQRSPIQGLDHKTHSYACEKFRNTLKMEIIKI
jgi:hypothetical protein